nr:putative transporter [Quercus suber]
MTEAGLFPGISYYLSCWYKRDEFGLRLAIFFSASALAGSFGGLLAAAISQMDGIGGKRGWADFPHDAKFISDDDRKRVLLRLKVDRQSSATDEKFNMTYFWAAVKDWKTWAFASLYMGSYGTFAAPTGDR